VLAEYFKIFLSIHKEETIKMQIIGKRINYLWSNIDVSFKLVEIEPWG